MDLGLDRSTVARILETSQFQQAIEYGNIRVHRMIPKACDALESELDKGNGNLGLKVLQGVGIVNPERDESPMGIKVVLSVQMPSPTEEIQ